MLVVCENFNPKTNPLLSSSMRQASFKCDTPRLELKSSRSFLAIKRCSTKLVNKSGACDHRHRGNPVKVDGQNQPGYEGEVGDAINPTGRVCRGDRDRG